jgi:hypothetical protein
MSDRQSIIDKIRKLLAKVGRGATEEEAASAVAMARRLMAEHQLSAEEVDSAADPWGEEECWAGSRLPPESIFVCSILKRHFFVQPIRSRRRDGTGAVSLFGEGPAVELGRWLYGRLVDQYRDLFRSYRAAGRRESDRRAYYLGLTKGLDFRLSRDRAFAGTGSGRELALADRDRLIDEALGGRIPGLKKSREIAPVKASAEGFFAGLGDASKLSVARPLGAGRPELPDLTRARSQALLF